MTGPPRSSTPTILYVSTDRDLVGSFMDRLGDRFEFDVLDVSTVEGALDAIEDRSTVDCVVCDDTVPEGSASDLFEAVRAETPGCPVLWYPVDEFEGAETVPELTSLVRGSIEERRTARALEERRKELSGIQRVMRVLTSIDTSLETLLSEIVELIPPAFQYPDHTDARLVVDSVAIETDTFESASGSIAAESTTADGRSITLEVVLPEGASTNGRGSFLPQEYELIETIVSMLSIWLERRQYVDELEESENRFRQVAENVDEIVWMSDPEKEELHYVSPAYETVWGRSTESLYETLDSFFDSVHPEDRERVETAVSRQSDGSYDEEYRIVRPNGEVRWVHDRAEPVTDDDGVVHRIVGLTKDVTERKEREQQLTVLDRVLRHNLRNEMNVALGIADGIADEADERIAGQAEEIERVCRRLLDLADEQRRIANLLSKPRTPRSQDLGAVLERIVEDIRNCHPAASIVLSNPESGTITTTPHVDVAIAELLENSIVHSDRETPAIEVTAVAEPDRLEITVADDGPGIPIEERTVLTAAEEPLIHGSGLGLWLVHWIVTHASGTVSFEENEPRGSVVTIALPNRSDSEDSPERS